MGHARPNRRGIDAHWRSYFEAVDCGDSTAVSTERRRTHPSSTTSPSNRLTAEAATDSTHTASTTSGNHSEQGGVDFALLCGVKVRGCSISLKMCGIRLHLEQVCQARNCNRQSCA